MTEQEKILDHLKKVFLDMESRWNGASGTLHHDFQKKSFASLKETPFPDRKHEDWKYTSAQRLISPQYRLAEPIPSYALDNISDLDPYVIPVINGRVDIDQVRTELLTSGIHFYSLQEAFSNSSWKETFLHFISPSVLTSNHAFELLNFTFSSIGFFMDIPKNILLEKPIEIRIIHHDQFPAFSHPLFFIRCGSGSEVTLFERFEQNITDHASAPECLINSLGYLHLEQNAHVSHMKWQNLPRTQNLVYKLLVTQQRDSRFETLAFDHGGATIRNNVEVELLDSHTFTSLQAGYSATGRQSMDHQTRINHLMPHCESHELYKGIIDDQASGAFNGKVYVHPDAQKTNAYQQNDTLVLSPNAVMNSKPQLEIFADDVKCSHGATIGQLDEKALFYLRTRGIDAQTARHMLKSAFLATLLESIPNGPIRHHISTGMSVEL